MFTPKYFAPKYYTPRYYTPSGVIAAVVAGLLAPVPFFISSLGAFVPGGPGFLSVLASWPSSLGGDTGVVPPTPTPKQRLRGFTKNIGKLINPS